MLLYFKKLLYVSFAILFVGCSQSAKNEATNVNATDSSATISQANPTNRLRVDINTEPPSLNPQLMEDAVSARVVYDLFTGLVDFDQTASPMPGMAKSWDISPDGKTYTFHLRDNLKFSDGSPILAKDFVYSWQRGVNPKTAAPYGYEFAYLVNGEAITKGKMSPDKLGIKAINEKTLQVSLVRPTPSFLQIITLPIFYVVPEKTIEKYGNEWLKPENIVTSGAYTLKEHVVKGHLLAEKNPNYYDAANVKIDQVKYFPVEDINTSASMFRSGSLDTTWTVPIDQLKKLKSDYPQQFKLVGQEATYYYSLNMLLPIFGNNPELRQALSMAVDRHVLTSDVIPFQVPLYSFVPKTVNAGVYEISAVSWVNLTREQQISQAQELYKKAGYSATNPLKITITYDTKDENKKVALAIASMWKNVLGVEVKVTNQDWKTFLASRYKGDFEVARNGWFADYADVSNYTTLLQCDNPQNDQKYCSKFYDTKISEVATTQEAAKQVDLYKEALQRANNDHSFIPLYQRSYFRLVSDRVNGYDIEKNSMDHVQSKWFSLNQNAS